MISVKIYPLTCGPYHHLFGFHDLKAWNAKNDRIVLLRVKDIFTPPDPRIPYPVGYVEENCNFVQFGETRTFNYPQGARQQWFADTNLVLVNDLHKGKFITKLYDTDTCQLIDRFDFPTHVVTDDGWAYGLDYARLFRLGVYGYAGMDDATRYDDAPETSGIIAHNLKTRENIWLLTVKDVVEYQKETVVGKQHYITHILLSPNQERIAFLHRSKLADGGEMTRLCTVGRDGKELRVLASGFLSHFDWLDNNHIMIFGRQQTFVEKLRQGETFYKWVPSPILRYGKKIAKYVYYELCSKKRVDFHWMCFSDEQPSQMFFIAEKMITEDGHPMFCPANRLWFVCDTYPDKQGLRELYLFNWRLNKKIELGKFKMLNAKPDLKKAKNLLAGTEPEILKSIGLENLAFTRSGLHCDLHPRWSPDGRKIAFDSIHEGTRQVYACDVGEIVK